MAIPNSILSDQPNWLSTRQAALFLGLKPNTLEKWRGATPPKGPKFFKPGGRVSYDERDLIAYLNSVTVEPS